MCVKSCLALWAQQCENFSVVSGACSKLTQYQFSVIDSFRQRWFVQGCSLGGTQICLRERGMCISQLVS